MTTAPQDSAPAPPEDHEAGPQTSRRRWRHVLLLSGLHGLLLCLGLWSALGGWIMSGFDALPRPGIDSAFNNYVLEHSYRVLLDTLGAAEHPGSLWSPPMFHPAQGTLAYSDNLLGLAPLYWALRPLLDPWRAFWVWTLLGFVGTYAAMAWACRRLGASHAAAAVAATLFAFGMPRLTQYLASHDQLVPQVFAPLAIVAAWSMVRRPRHLALAAMLLLILWQTATAVYLGWFLFLGFAIAAPLSLASRDHLRRLGEYLRRGWPVAAMIVALWVAALVLLMWPYVQVAREFGSWEQHYVANTLPRWHSYLRPARGTLWWEPLHRLSEGDGRGLELHLFLGFGWLVFLAIAAWAAISGRGAWDGWRAGEPTAAEGRPALEHTRRLVLVLLIASAVLVLLTFRAPTGHSIWWHVKQFIPGAGGIRTISRVWCVIYLFSLLATALGVTAWLRHLREQSGATAARRVTAVLAGLAIFAVAEQIHWRHGPVRSEAFDRAVSQVAAKLDSAGAGPEQPFFLYPPGDPAAADEQTVWRTHMVAMWASLRTGVPTVNGYSARTPRGYPADRQFPPPDGIRQWASPQEVLILRLESP